MIKKYHASLLLTAITHFGCMHSQKLGMSKKDVSQEQATGAIAVAFVDIDALAESAIANSTTMVDCAKFLTQRAVTCSDLTPIAAQDLPQKAIEFAEMMEQFVHSVAFGNNAIDLMCQHMINTFPELLITSPVSWLPEPTNETDVAIPMYQSMIELLHNPTFLTLRCALLCHPNYWPMPARKKDIDYRKDLCDKFKCEDTKYQDWSCIDNVTYSYLYLIKETFTCSDSSTITEAKDLMEKFLLKFPHLLIAPDEDTDIPLSNAIIQGQPAAALRLLELAEKAGMVEQVFNYQNEDGHTPFSCMPFSDCGNDVLERMLNLGAAKTVSMQDKFQRTAVHYCVVKEKSEKLTTILEHILKNFGEDGKQTVRTLLEQEDYQKTPLSF